MGFWNKLGKIALVAAPYVAAPFTGGASLAFTGAANKAAQKWMEHDAKKAAEKGLAPSKFDKYLGYAATGASLATGIGAMSGGGMGGGGGSAANTGKALSGWQKNLQTAGNIASGNAVQGAPLWQNAAAGAIGGMYGDQPEGGYGIGPSNAPRAPQAPQALGQAQIRPELSGFARNMYDQFGPVMGAADQSNPNLAFSLGQGRMEALQNQPFRAGYQVNAVGRDDQPYSYQQPPIYPQYQNQPGPQRPVWQNYQPQQSSEMSWN